MAAHPLCILFVMFQSDAYPSWLPISIVCEITAQNTAYKQLRQHRAISDLTHFMC